MRDGGRATADKKSIAPKPLGLGLGWTMACRSNPLRRRVPRAPVLVMIAFASTTRPGARTRLPELLVRRLSESARPPGLEKRSSTDLRRVRATLSRRILGTLIALALSAMGFRGRGATNMLIFLPMSTPEVVLGASLRPCSCRRRSCRSSQKAAVPEHQNHPHRPHHVLLSYVVVHGQGPPGELPPPPRRGGDGPRANEWITSGRSLPLILPG